MTRFRLPTRFGAWLVMLTVLLSLMPFCLPTEAADEAPEFYYEPLLLRADDYTEVLTGFNLFADNPDALPLQLSYAIYKSTDTENAVEIPSGWVSVTQGTPSEEGDDAAPARPAFTLDFHKPADIAVEGSDYLTVPEFLRPVRVSGTEIYTLAPGYHVAFRLLGGTPDENGVYPLDKTIAYRSAAPIPTFDLERPAKLIVQFEQKEGAHGRLQISTLNSEAFRALHRALTEDRDSFLAEYGLSDAVLYIQYDHTRMDVASGYDAEADDDINEVWSPETLTPFVLTDLHTSGASYDMLSYSFDDEAFRNYFPKNTFTEQEYTAPDADPDADPTSLFVIDTETTTLSTRVRYVLALTAQDGTVYYTKSAFTDPFYCGASNSLVHDPNTLDAPTLSDPSFAVADDGTTTLTFQVTSNTSVRDAAFWCTAFGKAALTQMLEISINGSAFTPYTGEFLSSPVPADGGEMSVVLSGEMLNEYAYIRVQLRYVLEELSLNSPWSAALAFDKKPEIIVTAPTDENTLPLHTDTTDGTGDLQYVCPICKICPAPYGVCLFLWIGAVVLVVLLVVLIIALIPKKQKCPRCDSDCHPQDTVCPTCGYRFVSTLPEIRDTTGDITIAKRTEIEMQAEEDAFFAMGAAPKKAPAEKTPPIAEKTVSVPPVRAEAEPTVSEIKRTEPKPDAAFLLELKRKMSAVKRGEKIAFTPEEIAYIKILKERAAAPKAEAPEAKTEIPAAKAEIPAVKAEARSVKAEIPAVKAEIPAADDDTREMPLVVPKPAAPKTDEDSREAQIARLRALRAKQLAEESAESEFAPPAQNPPLRRVEKPAKQIKCPACAVPNPETSGQCYICGTRLK